MSASLFSLKGQVAVITGAASGIGYAIATQLSAAGAQVAMVDRADNVLLKLAQVRAGIGLIYRSWIR